MESDPPQFSRIYPGSCWASTYPQLFLYLLKRLVQTQPLSERGGMLRGPGLFKQNEPCGERCLWHVTVVMRIIAEHIPPIWFTTSCLKVLSSDYLKSTRPNRALCHLGVTSVWHHRTADLCQDTQSTNCCPSPSTPNCKILLISGKVSEPFRAVPVKLGPSCRTRGSWFQPALVQ